MEQTSFMGENYMESTFNEQPNLDDSENVGYNESEDKTDLIYDYIKKAQFQKAIDLLEFMLKKGK